MSNATKYFLKTVLPLLLGSLLTLLGAAVTAHYTKEDATRDHLRLAYSQFFADTDAINDEVVNYYRDARSVFNKHFSDHGEFIEGKLTKTEQAILDDCKMRSADLQRRIRKHCFTILLVEPEPDWRTGVTNYMLKTITFLGECDQLVGLLPKRFHYDAELIKKLEAPDTLGKRFFALSGPYWEKDVKAFHDFVKSAVSHKRWQR